VGSHGGCIALGSLLGGGHADLLSGLITSYPGLEILEILIFGIYCWEEDKTICLTIVGM
jgi:hypothetical protein